MGFEPHEMIQRPRETPQAVPPLETGEGSKPSGAAQAESVGDTKSVTPSAESPKSSRKKAK